MLKIQNIKKSFGGVQAITGATFEVPQGKVTALIGPNGAGKTTIYNIICGLLPADEGTVSFRGVNLVGADPFNIARLGISRTFQQVRLFEHLTIAEHIQMIEDHEDGSMVKQLFSKSSVSSYEKWLEEYGIEKKQTALASDLSYGQKKLLDLMLAVKREHQLLMLDEPVAGVNSVVQARIELMLQSLKDKGETMLLIDHDMVFIRQLADHIIVLDAGAVLVQGEPEDVLRDERVLEAYLGS